MKRRDFMRTLGPIAVVPFFSNQLFAAAMPHSQLDEAILAGLESDRVIVIIQMGGGNDGLNMVLPLDQYTGKLAVARDNILIPETSALLIGTNTGLHPAMTKVKTLYDQQKLTVIQAAGYTGFNFSHFRASDIWMSGSDSSENISTGWLGRYVEKAYPDFPENYPNPMMPDPLSIRIGSSANLALQGYELNTAQTVPTNFTGSLTQLLTYSNTTVPSTNAGKEIAFLRSQQSYTNQYGTNIVAAWNKGANLATYTASPTGVNNNLGQQLKIVARLIKGGMKTRIYWVSAGGYDTHSAQVVSTDHTTGTHANLLAELSNAIGDFQADLGLLGLEDRVIGMTFSEFGRRIKSNGSSGTDHGTAAPMFLFGKKLNGGIIGTNPLIPTTITDNTQLTMQTDFRSVYMSVFRDWFCMAQPDAEAALGKTHTPITAIHNCCTTDGSDVVTIVGETNPCAGGIYTYKVSPMPADASLYNFQWAPVGGTVLGGNGTPTIQVQWSGASVPKLTVSRTAK